MAGPARRDRQMVERRPAVSTLDAGGSLGGHHGRSEPKWGCSGCPSNDRQHRGSRPSSGSGRKRGTPRQGFGRSRGGFTTKIHLRVNAVGLPMRTEITPGQTSDYLGFDLVMADNLPKPSVLLADRGYDADRIRKKMEERDVLTQIPMRKSRKMRVGGECHELCVSGPVHAVSDTQASKRSPNIMANWLRAANHSLTFLPSFSKLRMAR